MEQNWNNEAQAETELKRQRVASWIQNSLRPVDRLMKYDDLFPNDENEIATFSPQFEVREYQLDAWSALWDARQRGETHGLIHLATGLGKTSVAVIDAMKFREDFIAEHGHSPKIMFSVHQNDILEQAAEQFKAFIPDASIGFYNSRKKQNDNDITFATFQALRANLKSFTPEKFDYIIDDEVHHAKAETYEKVIRHFKPKFRLGLTATPNRADQKDIREIYGDEIYSKTLAEALSEGWLADPDYHVVFDDAVKAAMQSGFEVGSLKALKELFEVQPRNDVIAKNIKDEVEKLGLEFGSAKTIIFCQDIEHAEEMAELLGGRAYHSDTDRKDRQQIFNDFKYGNLQIITTRDMFNEGVDIPDARLLVFLRTTSSSTIFEQQLGRGLRKTKDKKRVSVLDFVANVERIDLIDELANQINAASERHRNDNENRTDTKNNPEDGIVIHTSHGDFDFEKMAIDLLEKYRFFTKEVADSLGWSDYSNEELIELALKLSPDTLLTQSAIEILSAERKFPSGSTIAKRFSSLGSFQEACGFEVKIKKSWMDVSNEDLVELAKSLSPDTPLTGIQAQEFNTAGLFPNPSTIIRRFESWRNFARECGFVLRDSEYWLDLTPEEIVAAAKELSPNTPLSSLQIQELSTDNRFVSTHVIYKIFRNMKAFHEACGFYETKKPFAEYSSEQLVELAKQLSPDIPLTQARIRDLSKDRMFVSTTTINKLFGNFSRFHQVCGFEVTEKQGGRKNWNDWTRGQIIAKALELNLSTPLSKREINEYARDEILPSVYIIKKEFGSLAEFHQACGFDVVEKKDWSSYTEQDYIGLALDLSPGTPLNAKNIDQLSKAEQFPSTNTIQRVFGNIKAFQERCGFDVRPRIQWSKKTDEELIALAIELSPNGPLTHVRMQELSKEGRFPSPPTIIRRFGSTRAFNEKSQSIP